jgi:hypothetical protein
VTAVDTANLFGDLPTRSTVDAVTEGIDLGADFADVERLAREAAERDRATAYLVRSREELVRALAKFETARAGARFAGVSGQHIQLQTHLVEAAVNHANLCGQVTR